MEDEPRARVVDLELCLVGDPEALIILKFEPNPTNVLLLCGMIKDKII